MFSRILSVLALVAFIGGGSWYFLRSTPQKQVSRLRSRVQKLLRREPGWEALLDSRERAELEAAGKDPSQPEVRLELARQAADQILAIWPTSESDLGLRAEIEALAGDLPAAVKVLDRFTLERPLPIWAHLQKAHLYRRMGMVGRANAELAAVVDEKPFQANLQMGEIELDLLLAERALAHFRRALAAARESQEDPRNRIDAQEKIAEALNLLIPLNEAVSGRLARGRGPADSQLEELRKQLADYKRERDEALDDAIVRLKLMKASSKLEYSQQGVRLARLHERYEDAERLRAGIEVLEQIVGDDEERRYAEIYLKLGELKLKLSARMNGKEAEKLVDGAEASFLDALSVREATVIAHQDTEDVSGPLPSPLVSVRESEGLREALLLAVADRLLGSSQAWRILKAERGGRKDRLGMVSELERIAAAGKDASAGRARVLRGLALLRESREADGELVLKEVAASVPRPSRSALERQLAEMCFRVSPDSMLFLKFLQSVDAADRESARVSVGSSVRLLTRALAHRRVRLEGAELPLDNALRTKLEGEVAELTRARQALIDAALLRVDEPEEYLALSGTVASTGGVDDGIEILKMGRDRLLSIQGQNPAKLEVLRSHLANRLFEKAATRDLDFLRETGPSLAGGAWSIYRESLAEYLPLFKEHPHRRDVLQRVVAIISRFKSTKAAPDLALTELIRPLFPNATVAEAAGLAQVLELLALGRFAEISARVDTLKDVDGLKPYSTLILGAVLLQQSQDPGRREGAPEVERARELRNKAKSLFEKELARSPDYLPIRIELARIRLFEVKPGEEVPESFTTELDDLLGRVSEGQPVAYPLLLLKATALRRRLEYLGGQLDRRDGPTVKLGQLYAVLSQERSVLRRAIASSPDLPEAYQALAESYLGGASEAPGRVADPADPSRDLLEPDFERAVAALRGAPESTAVLSAIAALTQRELKRPGEALVAYRQVVRREPTEHTLRAAVGCYMACADPQQNADVKNVDPEAHEKARLFLKEFEDRLNRLTQASPDRLAEFQALKKVLLGRLAQDQARFATSLEAKQLKEAAIRYYREALAGWRGAGKKPPIDVSNNLAWLLAEEGLGEKQVEEARAIIEEAHARLGHEGDVRYADAVEDTYAWVLYRQGESKKAEALYEKLVQAKPLPPYCYRYARVLLEEKKYRRAAEEIQRALNTREKYDELPEARKLKWDIDTKLQQKFARDTR